MPRTSLGCVDGKKGAFVGDFGDEGGSREGTHILLLSGPMCGVGLCLSGS